MAWPIIIANVTVPLLGAVDTAVVGHLPEPYYIGAVAIGAMLFNYIYHLFNCLRMGTTGPTAQARWQRTAIAAFYRAQARGFAIARKRAGLPRGASSTTGWRQSVI